MTATEVVKELYNIFNDVHFIDERTNGEMVVLLFYDEGNNQKELLEWCKNADIVKYEFRGKTFKILALEDEPYE